MKKLDKNDFLIRSIDTIGKIFDMLADLPIIELKDLNSNKTALVIVDMINGFIREGALKSDRVEELIPVIAELSRQCDEFEIVKLAFADCHTNISPEFDSYPEHCMSGSYEGEVVDEIKEIGGYTLIVKSSTNGFLEVEFQKWLKENQHIDTFIIVGDCTDICVLQFAITLKTWFNMRNTKSRIIIPQNAVQTYDFGIHNGDLMNVISLYNMISNGIEVIKEVR